MIPFEHNNRIEMPSFPATEALVGLEMKVTTMSTTPVPQPKNASKKDKENVSVPMEYLCDKEETGFMPTMGFPATEALVGFGLKATIMSPTAVPQRKNASQRDSENGLVSMEYLFGKGDTSFMPTMRFPATEALELLMKVSGAPKPKNGAKKKENMISNRSLKRSRSSMKSFDVTDLLDATQPVEESIAFISIAWNFDDDDSDNNYAPEILSNPRAKRHCRGLVRSEKVEDNLEHIIGQT
jgi:hypothetical protein